MTPISIAVFIMMAVAAGLGFSIAWIYKSSKLQDFLQEFKTQKALSERLKDEQESLVQHANTLQSEKMKLSQKLEKLNKRINALKDINQQLETDKDFIFNEYEQFKFEVKDKIEKTNKLIGLIDDLKSKNQKIKLKADKWKIKLHETQEQLAETEASFHRIKKERDQIVNKLSSASFDPGNLVEWEGKYKELKLKYLALDKEKRDLVNELSIQNPKAGKSMDSTLKKLSEEIVLLRKDNKALKARLEKAPKMKGPEEKRDVLERIRSRRKQMDFGRIGKMDPRSNDDLKRLKGLGPLMEKKFHAIGINTFYQLANFNEFDKKLLNYFLELSQGKIENEKWVEQARQIMGKGKKTVEDQAKSNLEKLKIQGAGAASPAQKDNLQSISGIGPYIEQKLNAIGIFRFEQLAKLSPEDIEEINNIMELAPGHIKQDDWVGQATRMK